MGFVVVQDPLLDMMWPRDQPAQSTHGNALQSWPRNPTHPGFEVVQSSLDSLVSVQIAWAESKQMREQDTRSGRCPFHVRHTPLTHGFSTERQAHNLPSQHDVLWVVPARRRPSRVSSSAQCNSSHQYHALVHTQAQTPVAWCGEVHGGAGRDRSESVKKWSGHERGRCDCEM